MSRVGIMLTAGAVCAEHPLPDRGRLKALPLFHALAGEIHAKLGDAQKVRALPPAAGVVTGRLSSARPVILEC